MISVKSQKQNIKISLEAFCAFLPWAILTFSAPLAFYSGLLMLFFLSFWYPSRFARITLAVCIVVGGAIGFGDSQFTGDMANYHRTYTQIYNGNFDAIFDYGKGVEIIMPLFWALLAFVSGFLDHTTFGILHSLCAGILFYIWLEKYAIKDLDTRYAALCVFLSLLMFNYWMPQWLLRQTFSSIFVLYALSANTRLKTLTFVLLATLCHVTGIIFFTLWWLLKKYPKFGAWCIGILCISFLVGSFFPSLYVYASFLPESFASKLVFYQHNLVGSMNDSFVTSIYLYILAIIICTWYYKESIDRRWLYIMIWYGILCLCANLIWSHFFVRVGLLYYYILLGFFTFISMQKNTLLLYLWGLVLFVNHMRSVYIAGIANLGNIQYYFYTHGLGGEWFYFLFN
ncbi:EpsG family protein [Helicobacter sp.]|uniref:EpsG family protein n=1 Tax=Helicobacter sp. TaxID=218 RepID=UPI002A7CD3C7|nr:EpsG family protein [Helicobacter sp.]MDY2822949.1 EpsG family protein [Helicobacter sp.]